MVVVREHEYMFLFTVFGVEGIKYLCFKIRGRKIYDSSEYCSTDVNVFPYFLCSIDSGPVVPLLLGM